MKTLKLIFAGVALLVIDCALVFAQPVQTITQEGTMKIDAVGHANLELTTKMNAQHWQNWMSMYGNSQHVLKRDMKNQFSAYQLGDFSVSKNDSDRKFTLNLAAEGAAVFRGGDRWEFELEEGMRPTRLNDKQWLIAMTENEGGVMLQQNLMVSLPDGVTGSAQAKGEFGEDVIRYTLPRAGATPIMLYAGIGLAVVGLGLLGVGATRRPDARAATA